jgi:UDP-N-acetyl-D-mannosaminuronic acid transferase (WecB/TagA/CpsF family)
MKPRVYVETSVYEIIRALHATMLGVGVAFDFAVARAPLWMPENGPEWMHRVRI